MNCWALEAAGKAAPFAICNLQSTSLLSLVILFYLKQAIEGIMAAGITLKLNKYSVL